MAAFEDLLSNHYDRRVGTLARIKSRSLGADILVLSALTVLTYAQLEGGIKDISASVIRHINMRRMRLGEVAPGLLNWRNHRELGRLRALVEYDMVGRASPFEAALKRRVVVRSIDRRREMNQMGWAGVRKVYDGFGLDYRGVEPVAAQIENLVAARNEAAHHGIMPPIASAMLEGQLRDNVHAVENVLTDLTIQLLTFFSDRKHIRR